MVYGATTQTWPGRIARGSSADTHTRPRVKGGFAPALFHRGRYGEGESTESLVVVVGRAGPITVAAHRRRRPCGSGTTHGRPWHTAAPWSRPFRA